MTTIIIKKHKNILTGYMSFSAVGVGGRGLFCVDGVSMIGEGGTGVSKGGARGGEGGADSDGGVRGGVGRSIGGRGFGGCEE